MNKAIAWFAENHVAANLLMAAILIGGVMTAPTIKQTIMPDFDFNYVSVTVVYPGASPEAIEKSVTIRVEEALEVVEGNEETRKLWGPTRPKVDLAGNTIRAKNGRRIRGRRVRIWVELLGGG